MRFAPNTLNLFKQLDPLYQLQAIKKCGFDYVEFLFPYLVSASKAKNLLEAFDMRVSIIDVLPGNIQKLDLSAAIDPGRVQEYRKYAQLALQYSSELKVRFVNCLSGIMGQVKDTSRQQMIDLYKENLAFTCDLFKDSGTTVLIEPVSGFQFPGYLTDNLHEAVGIIKELNRPNLALQFDFFHIQLLHGNLSGNVRTYFDIIKYYQIANPPGRHQPGKGELNFPFLIELLKELGYDDFIGLEYDPEGPSEDSFEWLRPYR
ncbi:MAG: TIM barrel protein [Spirochaetota bacterium]